MNISTVEVTELSTHFSYVGRWEKMENYLNIIKILHSRRRVNIYVKLIYHDYITILDLFRTGFTMMLHED